ncbi:CBS domain-containing protein [Sedimenticola hydrogenitrophicus]|uniref:CBS domain-containing protein n=1 Tax=Sedimenticola hydrogenitrophicus TaxID=2967975 RepID=UPI0021A66293|nr:CBS domain-containing protein [Sedimenticola hydrogenitrophicus]
MKITDIAIRRVPTIDATDTLQEAVTAMRKSNAGVLPVIEGGRLAGTLSERDILLNGSRSPADSENARVADLYRRNPLVCSRQVQLKTALQLMQQHQQSWLLVSDREGEFTGLITALELIDLLLELVPEEAAGPEMEYVHRVRGDQSTSF